MPVPQIHKLIESACPTSERQSCSEIYHGCSIAEMTCFLSQAVTLGNNDFAFHSASFLVLLSEVTNGKKGLAQVLIWSSSEGHLLVLVEVARNLNPELVLISGAVVFTNSRPRCLSKQAF